MRWSEFFRQVGRKSLKPEESLQEENNTNMSKPKYLKIYPTISNLIKKLVNIFVSNQNKIY